MVAGVRIFSGADHGGAPHQQGLLSISSSAMRTAAAAAVAVAEHGGQHPGYLQQEQQMRMEQQFAGQQPQRPGNLQQQHQEQQQRLFQQRQLQAAAEQARSRAAAMVSGQRPFPVSYPIFTLNYSRLIQFERILEILDEDPSIFLNLKRSLHINQNFPSQISGFQINIEILRASFVHVLPLMQIIFCIWFSYFK